jgi:FAD:protein FMN transferase
MLARIVHDIFGTAGAMNGSAPPSPVPAITPALSRLGRFRGHHLTPVVVLLCLLSLSVGCDFRKEITIAGRTMGTTYHVKVIGGYFSDTDRLRRHVETRLEEINRSMSTYRRDSEISRFNTAARAGKKFPVSRDFLNVMTVARRIYNLTGGAWDGTVKPLVNLWGFYGKSPRQDVPAKGEIDALLLRIGFDRIEILDGGLMKKTSDVSLDLASIAKGYGVDEIAALLADDGFHDVLVEIGGEVVARGHKMDGSLWRVGINRPRKDAPLDAVYTALRLKNRAVATSGDYRNFFQAEGISYPHVIDPRTGYPVKNRVVSVSIIADTCTFADGLATAIMVLGPEKGLSLINRLDGIEGLIVVGNEDGSLTDYYSVGFPKS